MIIKIQPDKQMAKSLRDMAIVTLERLREINKEKYPSNTLTDYYDIVRRLMEALNALDGIKIKGEGAHHEIIDYVCDNYGLGDIVKSFLQDMRDYRNRISYEGFNIKASYIQINSKKIEDIIKKLLELLEKKLISQNVA
jgi:hypothetical protein